MTDPHKAAVTKSNAQFIARMKALEKSKLPTISGEDHRHLIALAEERMMIEEHELAIFPPRRTQEPEWWVEWHGRRQEQTDLSTAIRSVVEKMGGKK